jgi:hypothetical protein
LGSPTPLPLQIKNQEANVMMNLNYISWFMTHIGGESS